MFQPFLDIQSLGKVDVEVHLKCETEMSFESAPSMEAITNERLDSIRPILVKDLLEMLDSKTRGAKEEGVKAEEEERKVS